MAKRKSLWKFLWILYLGIMIILLFCRSRGIPDGFTYWEAVKHNRNLNPFYTIENYMSVVLHRPDSPYFAKCLTELLGNFLLFVPGGVLLPKVFPKLRKFLPFLFTAALSVILIETVQLISLLGYFDVDDMILNFPGMILGYILFRCFH